MKCRDESTKLGAKTKPYPTANSTNTCLERTCHHKLLPVEWKPQAVETLRQLDEPVQNEIRQAVDEVANQQFSHPRLKPITDRDGNWIWRLKVKREHTDYRVFIDLEDAKLIIQDLDHRDNAYE